MFIFAKDLRWRMMNNHYNTLKADILRLQGFKSQHNSGVGLQLGEMKHAFPNQCLPVAAIHEFLVSRPADTAASYGFISALLSGLTGSNGLGIWVSINQRIFPNALYTFGLRPEHIVFVTVRNETDALWVIHESLKCKAVTGVIGEVKNISFNESRRLQLAVEESHATGFIIRNTNKLTNTACVSRWKVSSICTESHEGLPGVGFPRWKAELLRIRNGMPGCWEVQWSNGKLKIFSSTDKVKEQQFDRKAG